MTIRTSEKSPHRPQYTLTTYKRTMLYTLPFISALIGYVTNFLAVKMLFHPRKELNLGIVRIQGIFPKRQKKLAEKLGDLVAKELFSIDEIKRIVQDPSILEGTDAIIGQRIDDFLVAFIKSKPMLSMFITDGVKEQIKQTLLSEIASMLPEMLDTLSAKIEEKVDIKQIVSDKVSNFSSDAMEKMLYSIMSKEFTFIEILGGILGFVIGLAQMLLIMLTQ